MSVPNVSADTETYTKTGIGPRWTQNKRSVVAAARALELVEQGMVLGLGTGSTAAAFVDLLGTKVADGLNIIGVPTSQATQRQADALKIPLTTLDANPFLDMTVDGADELDDNLRLIKGGGGALLREKIVATASGRMVVIADDSKLVQQLGAFPLPIEVVEFGLASTRTMIEVMAHEADLDGTISLRQGTDGEPFRTDTGNLILDCAFGAIPDPDLFAELLAAVPGVVEHGLFLGIADLAIIAGDDGVAVLEAAPDDDDV